MAVDRPDVGQLDAWLEDNEGRWAWVRQSIARLLEHAFESLSGEADISLRSRLWAILERLTADPQPDRDYEEQYGGNNMDPVTLALNTVRGRAMQVVVGYALWAKRHTQEEGDAARLDAYAPEVARVLEAHLDPEVDASCAVRSVFGQYFPWLVLLDEEWVSGLVARIFTADPQQRPLRLAAWEAYLVWCSPYDSCYRLLASEYARAAREEEEPPAWRWTASSTPRVALGRHLLSFYWRGLLDLTDDAMTSFFAHSHADTRNHALAGVGHAFARPADVEKSTIDRLMALWEWRTNRSDELRELRGFAWWLGCECLPAEWRLKQLENLVARGGTPDPAHLAFEFLRSAAPEFPLRAVQAIENMVHIKARSWEVFGAREDIHVALEMALRSADASAESKALEVVHLLGAMGHSEFRDLARYAPRMSDEH